MSSKHGVIVCGGVIDAGYRGELIVLLRAIAGTPCRIPKNNAVAQLVVLPCGLHEPRIADCLGSVTERGNKGFGSSDLQENTARSAMSAIDAGELSDPDDDVSFGRFCLFDCSALSVIPSIDEPVLVRSIDVPSQSVCFKRTCLL